MLDNFVTSALQEDHLSLGTSAALKLQRLLGNLYRILGIEYLLAAQGSVLTSRRSWPQARAGRETCCAKACRLEEDDRWLAPDIASAVAILKRNRWPRAGVEVSGRGE